MTFSYTPIGMIHSPFTDPKGMPIQPRGGVNVLGSVEIFEQFQEGLADLEDFSHLILIYHFHQSKGYSLTVTPFLDEHPHGLFATRAPRRPNPIGLSIVKLMQRKGNQLEVAGIDILDQTPLVDIKPYVPHFDSHPQAKSGWLTGKGIQAETQQSDDRFLKE